MDKEKMEILVRILSIYLTGGYIKCFVETSNPQFGNESFIGTLKEIIGYDKNTAFRFEFEDDEGGTQFVFSRHVTTLIPYLRSFSEYKKLPLNAATYLVLIERKVDFMGLIDNYWAVEDKYHVYDD